jgi:hypothetical protein
MSFFRLITFFGSFSAMIIVQVGNLDWNVEGMQTVSLSIKNLEEGIWLLFILFLSKKYNVKSHHFL